MQSKLGKNDCLTLLLYPLLSNLPADGRVQSELYDDAVIWWSLIRRETMPRAWDEHSKL